jgi:hypothetical protein
LIEEERTGVWNVNAYIERERFAVTDGAAFLGGEKGEDDDKD